MPAISPQTLRDEELSQYGVTFTQAMRQQPERSPLRSWYRRVVIGLAHESLRRNGAGGSTMIVLDPRTGEMVTIKVDP